MAALERIYDFFLPSEFRDSADERRARVLLPAAVWMIVACLFFLLPLGAFQILGQRFLILGFSFAGLGLFILILLRYGHSVFAGYLVVGGLLLAANLQPVFSEGIYDTIYMLNILSIVTAGVLFGQRSVILVAMMAAAASLLLAYHTENGNILVRSADLMENRPGPYVEWFRRCSYLFMTVVLYWLGWKATNRALTASDETRSENRSLSRVLTNVLEQGQLGHWYWNIRTGEVYWSSNVAAIFGIPAAEFQGSFEAFLNLVLPEDRDHIRRALNRAFSDPASNYQVQHRIRNASNHIRWLEGRGTVRFEAGRPMDMAGVVVDITEQKRAQSALDRVYSILAEGIVIHDSSDAIVSFNESALEILELTGDQLRGKTTRDPGWSLVNVNGEPIKPDQMPSRICMRTGEPQYDITLGVQLANGTIRWLSVSAIPFSEDDSEQRGAVVSFFDITAPRNQSRELQKSEEQLRFILENQPSVVLMLDLDGNILYINNPTAGYRVEDIIGLHSSSFVPPEDRPRFQEYLRRIQVEQEPFSYDIRGYNSNGEISWFSTRIGLLEFQDQKRIILISTDVTDRVEAEQRLRTMAYTDLLTGLPNREALYSHLRRVVENANSEGPLQKDTAR
ncbi:MAG: PAS domain S-box protein, partial [Leptospiraceae bacterium]|nr:PAS domain S-box protein [Leptospiraceae bacterium]